MVQPCTAARRYVWPTNKLWYHSRFCTIEVATDPVTASMMKFDPLLPYDFIMNECF